MVQINDPNNQATEAIEAIRISLIQNYEADFLWKVSHKILNSRIIMKAFTHALSTALCKRTWIEGSWYIYSLSLQIYPIIQFHKNSCVIY